MNVEDDRYTISYRVYTQTGINLAVGSMDLGVWPGLVVDVDLYDGELSASGVSVFRDFRSYTASNYTETADLAIRNAAVRRMVADNTAPTMEFGVDRTSIYLSASETVMIDPSVSIPEHFPDLMNWRVQYDSFVKTGDSVTLDGTGYTVTDGILNDVPYLYNNELTSIDVPLTDLSVTVLDGMMTLCYGDGKSYTAELTDSTMTFGGVWYFDADLYAVTTGTATEYSYSGEWSLDWAGSIAIFIIMLALGSFILVKFRNPGMVDWLIVAFALAAGWVLL